MKQLVDVPRDGRRYEVVDGRLLVTGAQPPAHHAAVIGVMVQLEQACPPDLLLSVGSLDFRPTRAISLRPDLLVCRRADAGPRLLTAPPLLAVEVLSPSTRPTDVVLKRRLYEGAGVTSYWIFDPAKEELTALELVGGTYGQRAVVTGKEAFEAELPFPVMIVPADLVD